MSSPPNLFMRTGRNAVAGGGTQPGWVSGDLANQAANTLNTIVFDLGPTWYNYRFVQIAVNPEGPSTGLSVSCRSSDDAVFSAAEDALLNAASGTAFGAVAVAITSPQTCVYRPMGRYFIVRPQNTDLVNAQGPNALIRLTAYSS